MYKEIFRWVIAIISQPAKAWVLLAKKGEKQEEFLSRFVYPLIGFVTVAAFLGVLFTRKEFDVELALKSSIKTLVVYPDIGVLVRWFLPRGLSDERDMARYI